MDGRGLGGDPGSGPGGWPYGGRVGKAGAPPCGEASESLGFFPLFCPTILFRQGIANAPLEGIGPPEFEDPELQAFLFKTLGK